MNVPLERRAVALAWLDKADSDLANARSTIKMRRNCPYDTNCFHAQQSVEKCLKALLVWNGLEVTRSHDISALLAMLPDRSRPGLTVREASLLSHYAIVTRYPGEEEPFTKEEAQQALSIAGQVRQFVADVAKL